MHFLPNTKIFCFSVFTSTSCVDDESMKDFCCSDSLKSLIKEPTCFKNPENLITNKSWSFHSTCVIEAGLSESHRMTVSVLKMHFNKLPPKVISCRDFKKIENERFIDSLFLALNSQNVDCTKNPDLFLTGTRMNWIIMLQEKKVHLCEE